MFSTQGTHISSSLPSACFLCHGVLPSLPKQKAYWLKPLFNFPERQRSLKSGLHYYYRCKKIRRNVILLDQGLAWDISLYFSSVMVSTKGCLPNLSALTATVMSPSGRTLSLRLHTEIALCDLGAKQAGFPVSTSWDTPSPTADRKSSVEQTCITESSNRDLGELPGPSHPHPPPTSLFSKPWFMTL